MTTPPMPFPGMGNSQQAMAALISSAQAQTQANRQILQSLQAMQHMMQTYNQGPGGPTPAPPVPPGPGGPLPPGIPTPTPPAGPVPTTRWLRQQAISMATRSSPAGHSSGASGWLYAQAPTIGARIAGPWGAVAGVGLQVASQIPGEIRSQRDKNAYYQSAEGGSNFSGFGERLHEEAYRWSTFGVLSSDEARNAFKGVTRLGYNSKVEGGPGRQQALNFVYHGKTAYGATVDESLTTLQAASQAAVDNLKGLSAALKDVSDSAGKAGINAQQARADFTNLITSASQGGMTGNVAVGSARLQENIKSSLGRSFQSADFSGQNSSGFTMLAAAVGGVSVSDYLTNSNAQDAAKQTLYNLSLDNVLKPGVKSWVQNEIQKSGKSPLDEESLQDIASRMLQQFYPSDPFSLAAALSPVMPDGNKDPLSAAKWVVKQIETQPQGGLIGKAAQDIKNKDAAASKSANSVQYVSGGQKALDHETSWYAFGMGGSKAVDAYQKWSKANGMQDDPVVRSLLGAVKGDNSTKVLVTTKDGKKVVSLEDAVKNHRNELATGNAIIMEGDKGQVGHSVKDLVGASNVDATRGFSDEASKADNSGTDLKAWEASHRSSTGGLTIGLTPEAKRLLTVMESSGTSGAAASASPPSNPNAMFPSLPSVGG